MTADAKGPSDEELNAFLATMQTFRSTLSEGDQRLLDSMFHAAMGTHEETNDEVHAYWVAGGGGGVRMAAAEGYGSAVRSGAWGSAYNTYSGYYG